MSNPFELTNKNLLITGASSGIGKQIAISTSQIGAKLKITGRNEEKLLQTFNNLTGEQHHFFPADLSDETEIDKLVDFCSNLDGIVLSAGVTTTVPFKFISFDELNKVMQINFYSPVLLLSKLLRQKKINKGCSIVFISSIGGNNIGAKGNSIYSASKGAINAIQKVLTVELAAQKIRVNNVSPGMVRTEMWENSTSFTVEQINEDEKKYPLGYGEPIDVAHGVIYLLSDASRWVTGISLILDGGFTIQ